MLVCHTALLALHNILQAHINTAAGVSRIPVTKKKLPPSRPSKGGPAKNLYTKSDRMTISVRDTWAWYED